jgi:hypothetical protein
MEAIARRKLMQGGAALAVAAAVPVAAKAEGGGELARLVRLYFDQCDAFNAYADRTDDAAEEMAYADALADETFDETMRKMVGVPVRTREDALAVLEWLVKDDAIELDEEYAFGRTAASLISALRSYLEGRVA